MRNFYQMQGRAVEEGIKEAGDCCKDNGPSLHRPGYKWVYLPVSARPLQKYWNSDTISVIFAFVHQDNGSLQDVIESVD